MQIINQFITESSAFNPITGINWAHAYWVGGTEFIAKGYSDGGAVSNWPDEIGTDDLTEGTDQPVYRATDASFDSQPIVEFNGTNDRLHTNFSTISASSIVMVGRCRSFQNNDHLWSNNPNKRNIIYMPSGGNWNIYAGSAGDSGTARDTSPHLFTGVYNLPNEVMELDGTELIEGAYGTETIDGLLLGENAGGTRWTPLDCPFIGVYDGDVRADGGFADFEQWVEDTYNITIA